MNSDLWSSLTPAERELYLDGPALPPPSGVQPDFTRSHGYDATVIGVITVCMVLSTTFIFIRTYAKLFVEKKVKFEDVLMLLSFGPYIGYCWCMFRILGLGGCFVHQWNITARDFQSVTYFIFIRRVLICFITACSRTAILLEWLRVFVPQGTRNLFFWASWLVLFSNAAFYIAALFAVCLICRPLEKAWKPMIHGSCLDLRYLYLASPYINLFFDLAIFSLPQRTIWSLNMSTKRKLGISLIFSVGILACANGIGRIIIQHVITNTADTAYWQTPEALCGIAEMTCLFLVFCISAAPKVFTQYKVIIRAHSSKLSSYLKQKDKHARSDQPRGRSITQDRKYHTKEESQAPLTHLGITGDTAIELSFPENSRRSNDQPNAKGILRTTTFMTKDERTPETYHDQQFIRQHPWVAPNDGRE
ncbi:uncharacterized protein GGS22DRAFT_141799 [Annulohypoxylon maeteangense]|uniref:uncharacterized protein n=1 Tax=Annulohypoxylon maeteangense TaxID=1927788 RepID=UPI002008C906|nr:uncharacterized protein GGS22DRAFT_141799 [Annulohypoxylon maeteangense]KAI0885286.1 hypothetical protein GGS22DRAFT_141799 [Annulohypoxylon maeteangense]